MEKNRHFLTKIWYIAPWRNAVKINLFPLAKRSEAAFYPAPTKVYMSHARPPIPQLEHQAPSLHSPAQRFPPPAIAFFQLVWAPLLGFALIYGSHIIFCKWLDIGIHSTARITALLQNASCKVCTWQYASPLALLTLQGNTQVK